MDDTNQLLSAYVSTGSESAFAEIVRRHVDFVYSVALRKVGGDRQLAEDVTQAVFANLARKAKALPKDVVLTGWLHRVTCFRAADVVRTEYRRREREQKALEMHALNQLEEDQWTHLSPLLDDALGKLSNLERDALLLRFFEGKSWRETGQALALGEDAVQKRAGRALEKLRGHFARRGILISAASLTAAFAANSVQAAPAALAASVAGTALGAGSASLITSFVEALLMTTKTKVMIAAGVIAVAAPMVWQQQNNSRLRKELSLARQENSSLAAASQRTAMAVLPSNSPGNRVLDWRALESPDYRQYIANLRAAGCPEQTIRDIIITDLERNYGQRIAKLSPATVNAYWRAHDFTDGLKQNLASKQIHEEKRAAIRELLGVDADEEAGRRTGSKLQYEEGFEFLPADVRRRLREIDRQVQMKLESVDLLREGWFDPEYKNKKNEALAWKQNTIKELLSPEQFEEYEMRTSHAAFQLQNGLRPFNPTEEEFRTIYRLNKQLEVEEANSGRTDPATGRPGPASPEQVQRHKEAVRQALGEERYADYELATDLNYVALYEIARAHELPEGTARAVYDMHKAAEQQAAAIRQNSSLTPEAREAAFQGLVKQTEGEALRLLGTGGPLYKHQFAGWFYQKLSK